MFTSVVCPAHQNRFLQIHVLLLEPQGSTSHARHSWLLVPTNPVWLQLSIHYSANCWRMSSSIFPSVLFDGYYSNTVCTQAFPVILCLIFSHFLILSFYCQANINPLITFFILLKVCTHAAEVPVKFPSPARILQLLSSWLHAVIWYKMFHNFL